MSKFQYSSAPRSEGFVSGQISQKLVQQLVLGVMQYSVDGYLESMPLLVQHLQALINTACSSIDSESQVSWFLSIQVSSSSTARFRDVATLPRLHEQASGASSGAGKNGIPSNFSLTQLPPSSSTVFWYSQLYTFRLSVHLSSSSLV